MEKYNNYISKAFLILFCISISINSSFWFLWNDHWFDLYKTIDKWIDDLELKNYEFEISWWWESVSGELNRILETNWLWECIKDWIDAEDIKEIVKWNSEKLASLISEDCFVDWEIIGTIKFNDILKNIVDIDKAYTDLAEDKTKKTYEIAHIGLYSDWSLENSPFDLIADLKSIDEIIFTREIEYNWEESYDIDAEFEDFLKWLLNNNLSNSSNSNNLANNILNDSNLNNNTNTNNTSNSNNTNPNNSSNVQIENPYNTYVCSDNLNNSWLNSNEKDSLIAKINYVNTNNYSWNQNNTNWNNSSWNNSNWIGSNTNSSQSKNYLELNDTWYKKVNDNAVFPCNDTFCIEVDFKTYNFDLLWWWQTYSIEKILKRSNEHLKQFAATSLVQSKMTTNFFELGLRDLSLPDIFHMWIQISKKSPPILNIDNWEDDNDDKEKDELSYTNLLEKYYEANWLEYKRRNDIQLFQSEINKTKSIIDSAGLEKQMASKKIQSYLKEREETKKKFDYISDAIDRKYLFEDMWIFYYQLVEVERFIAWINDYTTSLYWIVKWMKKIPVHK